MILHLFSKNLRCWLLCPYNSSIVWHLGASRGAMNSSDDPISATNLLLYVDDCIQYSNSETSDDGKIDSGQST